MSGVSEDRTSHCVAIFTGFVKTRNSQVHGITLLSYLHGYDRVLLVCVVFKFEEHIAKSLFSDSADAT